MRTTGRQIALFGTLSVALASGAAWAGMERASVSCNSASACAGGNNTGAGPGVAGTSAGIGVEGTSAKSNPGVFASTAGASAVIAKSVAGYGARGTSASSYGVLATTASAKAPAILAEATGKHAAYAASGIAPAGTGVAASGLTAFSGTASAKCPPALAYYCAYGTGYDYLPITALTVQTVGTQPPLVLRNAKNQVVFSIDSTGTMFFAGKLSCPNDSLYIYDNETREQFYICVASQINGTLARTREPAEFDGQAQLVDGAARVALAPETAAGDSEYQVYLTPLGDTAGRLFVERKSTRGFVVRARGAAARSVPFAYRIVAGPARLPGDSPASANPIAATPAPETASAPTLAAPAPCTSASACVSVINTGAGPAVEGASKAGYGVVGTTTGPAGTGVEGSAAASSGAYGASTGGYGISATSVSGTALAGTTSSNDAAGVVGNSTAPSGTGIAAVSSSGAGVFGSGIRSFSGSGAVVVRGTGGAPLLIVRHAASKRDIFSVDDSGGIGFGNRWNCPAAYNKTAGTCNEQDTLAAGGAERIERTGEASLIDGAATVALDPSLARRLDPSRPYSVTLTPEGDSAGWIYVAARTPTGFTVREHGGRSSIPFEYDLVAEVPAP